ncbi:MAG: hypothetical protein NT051_03490 [Candidatus Micrarchaeota archaeon]|nr:hypothetical protein [Candidatus Micrarchaeota archaeon]
MEEKILKIVIARLRKYGSEPINTEKLAEIRSDVFKATKTNKFASFSNVKKWVKAARNEMRKSVKPSKAAPAPSKKAPHKAERVSSKSSIDDFVAPPVSRKIEDSVNLIKGEAVPLQEVSLIKPTIVFDKVYLQSIKFEIAGIRQTMERVSRQLDRLEKALSSHGKDE